MERNTIFRSPLGLEIRTSHASALVEGPNTGAIVTNIEVLISQGEVRRWHLELLNQLADLPRVHAHARLVASEPSPTVRRMSKVFALERLLAQQPTGLADVITPAEIAAYAPNAGLQQTDLQIDLTSTPGRKHGVWRLEYDGRAGDEAAITALRSFSAPYVALVDGSETIATGRPGSETPGVLLVAYGDLLAGCLELIMGAVSATTFAAPSIGPPQVPQPVPSLAMHSGKQIVRAAAHGAYRALYRAPHWRVGWRRTEGRGLVDSFDDPPSGWHDLPDDGHRFYADPFPFEHGGQTYLFVEDFEHRLGRGVISVVEFDARGPIGKPRQVLEHEVHLSYPFVVEDCGELWMIPETSAAGTVELYRATAFPDQWTLETILLKDVEASDATVFRRGDQWWMTATVRRGGSFSDALHLWHADELTGPWVPHADNPVLIDIASARPAGRIVNIGDQTLRPVQDGRRGYGAGLAIAEIIELDEHRFQQRVLGRLEPGEWWPGRRLHTLNKAGTLECIDGSAMAPRFRPPHRRGAR